MAIYQWTDADGTGDFGDPNNWINPYSSPPMSGTPGPGDTAILEATGTITGNGDVGSLILEGEGGLLTMSYVSITTQAFVLAGSVALANESSFAIAQEMSVEGTTTVTASGGSYIDIDLTSNSGAEIGLEIGVVSGDQSAFNLTGLGTEAIVQAGDAVLGEEGTGMMTISAGAELDLTDTNDTGAGELTLGDGEAGQGTLVVTGAYSALAVGGVLDVGEGGIGRLTIEGGAEATVSPDQDQTTTLVLGDESGSNGSVLVTGAGSRLIADTNDHAYIGYDGAGALTVASGALVELGTLYAGDNGGTGSISVQGTGSVLELRKTFFLGLGGAGTLSVSSGGQVVSAASPVDYIGYGDGSSGVVSVSGAGSSLNTGASGLFVGYEGTGKITVSTGGTVVTGSYGGEGAVLGGGSGTTGTVTINGTGASFTTSGAFQVGSNGTGTLLVEAGGALKSGDGTNGFLVGVGSGAVGSAEVTGSGSSLTNSGNFLIGYYGAGTLMVLAGATITTSAASGSGQDGAIIGNYSGGSGHVTVSGTGSKWSIGSDLVVGDAGTGTLTIGAGGLVTAASLVTSESAAGTLGVSGTGAELTVSGNAQFGETASTNLSIGTGGLVSIGGSAVIADAKVSLSGGTLNVAKPLTLDASQTIMGSGSLDAASIVNAGTIGSTSATMSCLGSITGTGKLTIGSGTTLSLGGSVGSGQSAAFAAATGTLLLGAPTTFAAAIEDFVKGDVIDLGGITATSLTFSGHTLTVHESGGASFGLTFDGSYTSASFAAPKSDGHGGTLITHT